MSVARLASQLALDRMEERIGMGMGLETGSQFHKLVNCRIGGFVRLISELINDCLALAARFALDRRLIG